MRIRIARLRSRLVRLMPAVLLLTYAVPVCAQETERDSLALPPRGQPAEVLPGQLEGQGENDGTAEALAGAVLSDPEILHVFLTANRGEVVASRPVGDGAEEEVTAYARHMIDKHSDVIRRADSLAMALGVEPQANTVSRALEQIAQGVAQRVEGLDDPDHRDMQYMESQIALHRQTLDLLDFVLIPNAQDESLRALLSQTRADVMRHLAEAREIHDGLD